MVELLKLAISFSLECFINQQGSTRRTYLVIKYDIQKHQKEFWKLAIPAALYAIQNNLCYLALKHLSAVSFQVIYQMKILTTALFSVLILGRRIEYGHWVSLWILMIGVVAVQLSGKNQMDSSGSSSWFGFLVLLFNSISSGFAGVYFELLSKAPKTGCVRTRVRPKSLWMQSFQLGILGFAFSALVALFTPSEQNVNLLSSLKGWTILTVALQSVGGLLVAVVIRYADNIQKAFATSLSIVLCSFISIVFLGHQLPLELLLGSALVVVAVVLYARAEKSTSVTRSKGLPRRIQSAEKL